MRAWLEHTGVGTLTKLFDSLFFSEATLRKRKGKEQVAQAHEDEPHSIRVVVHICMCNGGDSLRVFGTLLF